MLYHDINYCIVSPHLYCVYTATYLSKQLERTTAHAIGQVIHRLLLSKVEDVIATTDIGHLM